VRHKPIRVLIVDDSAVVRETLSAIFSADPALEVIGTASDPYVAVERMRQQMPDVITLDIEMPRMDGLTFLKKLMSQHPLPVVICSSLAGADCETTLRALELGALDVIEKPQIGVRQYFLDSQVLLCDAVKAAAAARLDRSRASQRQVEPKNTADVILPAAAGRAWIQTTERVVAVGASTGGTEALRVFLEAMPADAPGTVIVQHMPKGFTTAFARRLDSLCTVAVKEAADGDVVQTGQVLIAPGDLHTLLKRSGARYHVEVRHGPLVTRHRPSVDVLFRSVARYAGRNAVGVIMTGMGDDGARGMAEMKRAGAATLAQDEATCVVYGMPKEAVNLGGVDRVLALEDLAPETLRLCR
jgi:two-component system chemotaxis response regulator CheB